VKQFYLLKTHKNRYFRRINSPDLPTYQPRDLPGCDKMFNGKQVLYICCFHLQTSRRRQHVYPTWQ